ncbi:Zn(II)2Cys6 transcription factor rglT [Aspergillus clavatus NRRL 1]|uniref:C6 finger domain protein, putative n=1 Tax=Aspergillus clavatus (strain ATCC 1007 / CBS 513.65 / DSM 816 / NCTC 3887 / NRRL 1 / QM 1276 / 107) TaxID=344612 RepID=A1CQJ0_ASPCL|nr:C6 finger domain protein, putative [Aspergillus clavatus NRRL 1]EAW07911.1 C6 finger domain protein, putative [Aspergillus clavatus NRRL 1]
MQFDSLEWNQPFSATTSDRGAASVPPLKRHAACDECRKRKLKCSGEATGCSRCLKQSLVCHYSLQKQMGRPPKKRMREDNDESIYGTADQALWSDMDDSTRISSEAAAVSEALHLFSPVYTVPMRMPQPIPNLLSTDDSHNHLWRLDHGRLLNPVPATSGPWPDFSSVSAATACPFAIQSGLSQMNTPPLSPPSTDISNSSPCTCLSYLYLCLSHLASLAPFPISQHTLCSLCIAAKTARAVIQCDVCPTSFASAMQNVMFTGTLLNVMADAWLRVSMTDAEELCKSAAPPAYVAALVQNSSNLSESWKEWLRQTVRNAITGGSVDPAGQVKCSDSPTLMSLVEEMEARQHRWHQSRAAESPDQSTSSSPPNLDDRQEGDMLCLRVLRNVRDVIDKFEFAPHEYPESSI